MSATSPGVTLGGTNLAGGYSPETFLQMSKKIAQMTQVIDFQDLPFVVSSAF